MINKVILVGNVGSDPEVRSLETGVKVARLRLATTERFYNSQTKESNDHTEWHTVTLWRGLADVADRYVRKGSQVYIEGKLRSREWTDKDGNKRYGIEILAEEMKLLGRRTEGGAPAAEPFNQPATPTYNTPQPQAAIQQPPVATEESDDLPF